MRDTKQELIEAGAALFVRHSFQGTGLNDILKAAGVPKGSFYHHFSSKEDFGLAVIEYNREQQRQLSQAVLGDGSIPAPERLRHYLAILVDIMAQNDCSQGCPIGTMAQEMSALSPAMREALEQSFADMETPIARMLDDGQKAGDIRADMPAEILARLVVCAMQGALIEIKTLQSTAPLETVAQVLLQVLTPPSPADRP